MEPKFNPAANTFHIRKVEYQPDGILINSKSEVRSAHKELDALQEMQSHFDMSLMDYKEWAKEDVSYSEFEEKETMQRLQKCNDSYALAMFSNCLTPFKNGINVKTIMTAWFMSKTTQAMNPNIDMDMSRALMHMRGTLVSTYAMFEKDHPAMSFLIRPFINDVESVAMSQASDRMNKSIETNLKEHTIDSMVMTPRQIAALKLNFMEQCYVDMRKGSSVTHVNDCEQKYNTAVAHLAEIAKHSGFDMTVVAAEERYLAGLKMSDNTNYTNLFVETEGIYGVKPYIDTHNSNVTWDGSFSTADGHAYYVGNHKDKGAFTVRKPLFALGENAESELCESIHRRAEQYAAMVAYLDSGSCELPTEEINLVKRTLSQSAKVYKKNMISLLRDDGLCKTHHQAVKAWESHFTDIYKATLDDPDSPVFKDFNVELNRILNKEIITRMGAEYTPETARYITSNGESGDSKVIDKLKKDVDARAAEHKAVDSRTGLEVLRDMRYNYIDTMQTSEIAQLMLHVGANMEQGMMSHGEYGRVDPASESKKQDEKSSEQSESDQDTEQKHVDLSKDSGRDRTVPDVPADDTKSESDEPSMN